MKGIKKNLILFIAICIIMIVILISLRNDKAVFFPIFILTISSVVLSSCILFVRPAIKKEKEFKEMQEKNIRIENMRREFVANVSHDLKTPLTSISGFIETLQSGTVKDEKTKERFIEIIAIETARLNRLIEDVLILSDIETKPSAGKEYFRLDRCCHKVAEVLYPIAKLENISIHIDARKPVEISGSEDRFIQMLMNLIENAIKYGKKGGNVYVCITEEDEKIFLKIKDDGIGIAPEHIDRITERFYRVDKSRSKDVGGTGLGLSIVKHTVALFNGKLIIKSKPGEGSVFTIVLIRE